MQVLRDAVGWNSTPYQWAVSGYMGAIDTGRTICGFLFGGAVFLGYLAGEKASDVPALEDPGRIQAIAAVKGLFQGFVDRFGTTDCHTLTGCDFSQKRDVQRYFGEKIYENTCYRQFEHVLEHCLAQLNPGQETP